MVFSVAMRPLIPFRSRVRDCEWVGGRYPLLSKVREGGEVIQPDVVLWLELPRGVIVSVTVIDPRAPVAFETTLAEAMKHPAEGSPRKPARIRVPEKRLAEALKGTVDGGTTVVVGPVPELDAVFADLVGSVAAPEVGRNDPCPCGSGKKYKKCHLNAGGAAGAGAAPPRETVHEMDFRLVGAILQFGIRGFGEAWLGEREEDFHNDEAVLQLFLPWAAWTCAVDGKRVAQHFLDANKRQLSEEDRAWFDAQARAWLSVWEVTRVEPGTVGVRDLLTGQKRSVLEIEGSRILVPRDTILARMVDFRETSLFGGMYGRVLPPMEALEVVRGVRLSLRAGRSEVTMERLTEPLTGHFMIHRWRDEVAEHDRRAAIPPMLENTDGEPLLFVTDSFKFDAAIRSEVETRLTAMDGVDNVDKKKSETVIVFIKPGNRVHQDWENTVVGRAVVGRNSLRVETNSEPRADALGRRVRDACAGLLRGASRKAESPAAIAAAGGPASAPRAMSSREEALLRKAKEAHYRDWVDSPVPALGGRTPRSASRSKTKAFRDKLDLLLRDMENRESHLPAAQRFAVARLREELGMEEG
jgi:SEC-C motif